MTGIYKVSLNGCTEYYYCDGEAYYFIDHDLTDDEVAELIEQYYADNKKFSSPTDYFEPEFNSLDEMVNVKRGVCGYEKIA